MRLDDQRLGELKLTYATGEVNQFGILANLKPLMSAANDALPVIGDKLESIWLDSQPSETFR